MRGYWGGRRNSLIQPGFQLSFVSPRPDPFDSVSPEGNLPIFWDKKKDSFLAEYVERWNLGLIIHCTDFNQ